MAARWSARKSHRRYQSRSAVQIGNQTPMSITPSRGFRGEIITQTAGAANKSCWIYIGINLLQEQDIIAVSQPLPTYLWEGGGGRC